MFSKGTPLGLRSDIQNILGISKTAASVGFLGAWLEHESRQRRELHLMVSRVQSRLTQWSGTSLSLAGRKVVIESISSAIPMYWNA